MNSSINFILSKIGNFRPEIGLILGSGLSSFCNSLDGISIKYADIPDFPKPTVEGHRGELLFCQIGGKNCVIMQGRLHFYEGYSLQESTYPVKILKKLGIKTLIVTNAAGAANHELNVGDIMLIKDHINFIGTNPLIGKNDDTLGTRFPDMSDCYSKELQGIAQDVARDNNIDLKMGIYLATTGPSYETAAEVRAFRLLGADVIGMSTVPEVIMANYLGINVAGFSLVTNYATGVGNSKLSHQEVIDCGLKSCEKLSVLVRKIVSKLD